MKPNYIQIIFATVMVTVNLFMAIIDPCGDRAVFILPKKLKLID